MAAKKKKGQLSLRFSDDERIPKLAGVLLLFLALYLFIAFTSYLFTWHIDQDRVLRFSWELLLDSRFEMANWLGRLGAILSNFFFYYLFGLPSFLLVYLFALVGSALIRRIPVYRFTSRIRYTVILMFFLSLIFEFLFGTFGFPWGGAIGDNVNLWLFRFVGTAGQVVLFGSIAFGLVVWRFNPNFDQLSFGQAMQEVYYYFEALIQGKVFRRAKPADLREAQSKLRPGPKSQSRINTSGSGEQDIDEEFEGELPDVAIPALPADLKQGGQLAFDLNRAKNRPPVANSPGDLELEMGITEPEERLPIIENAPDLNMQPLDLAQEENPDHSEPYDPTLELSSYEHPVLALLNDYSDQKVEIDREELEANKDQIIETLLHYKIEITKIRATIGPTVTLYEIIPAPGVRISRIKNLEDDIALSLSALGIRIIAPIPGKGTIGIEVPNKKKQIVSMKEVLMHEKFKKAKMDLPIALGKTISNEVFVADLAKMPHLLVAGATGQGKSVGINTILVSLLYKKHPSQVKLVLIDPKKVELFPYSKLDNHFLAFLPNQDEPIITDTTKVIHTLNSLCMEMDNRYDLLKKASARNIREYNDKFVQRRLSPLKGHKFLPFIVLVIDEFADLIMTAGKEIELPIGRLAQLARAVGIHLVIATQRPSVNIITGVIKANFPARIGYKVTSKIDSRTILDAGGAEQLIGRGDMLLSVGGEMIRLQGAFIDTPEVENVIDFITKQQGYPEPYFLPEYYGDDEPPGKTDLKYTDLDEMFEDSARLIVQSQHGSTSMIQRRLKLGYNRAGRIMDQLEAMGIVGPSEGSKAREVLIYDEGELERFLADVRTRK
ncbi:FtsK/SpoIIIE family DNA translocase [Haliscomenobacter hydrossis]|uniref:Cell division protein FtsK/SpoIIIE n=1 Tax=Haliscomenobacter hydrossis (strain ATCC 27775 / DSM 1100 / LMG 10767 / O) TaxID=760192 RepID=F4L425_HALH1|nr:DNA translocase FtsK [Haliscomenobacter hydrossis]AEE49742.1 cell division protein FtsK/SpoIIIE [Haliscomenobacter hydrossis DSM 1100]